MRLRLLRSVTKNFPYDLCAIVSEAKQSRDKCGVTSDRLEATRRSSHQIRFTASVKDPLTLSLSPRGERTLEQSSTEIRASLLPSGRRTG